MTTPHQYLRISNCQDSDVLAGLLKKYGFATIEDEDDWTNILISKAGNAIIHNVDKQVEGVLDLNCDAIMEILTWLQSDYLPTDTLTAEGIDVKYDETKVFLPSEMTKTAVIELAAKLVEQGEKGQPGEVVINK